MTRTLKTSQLKVRTGEKALYWVLFEFAEAELCRTCLKAVVHRRDRESERHNGEVLEYNDTTPGYCDFCD